MKEKTFVKEIVQPKHTLRYSLINWLAGLLGLQDRWWPVVRIGWNRETQSPMLALVNSRSQVIAFTILDDQRLKLLMSDMGEVMSTYKMVNQ